MAVFQFDKGQISYHKTRLDKRDCGKIRKLARGKAMKRYVFALLIAIPAYAHAVEYECTITKKLSVDTEYSESELSNGKFSVIIEEHGFGTFLSRCSFVQSESKVTCDRYEVDKVVVDNNVKIKKYYVFDSHFDVQLFSDLTFIENNGRGGLAFGSCKVTAP